MVNEEGHTMRGKRITLQQEEEVVRLYKTKQYAIREIMKRTGVKSEQTIYRILSDYNIPMIRRKSVSKISVNLDEETAQILKKANPKNVSEWISNCIKKAATLL